MTADQIGSLHPALAALLETFRPYMGRVSNFGHLLAYVLGLTADLKRKSIEPIALAAGAAVRTLQVCGVRRGVRESAAVLVRACQTGGRVGGVRGAHLSQSPATLVLFATGDVLPGRSAPTPSGGKIRGSRWSRWRRRPTLWHGPCGSVRGARRMKSPNDVPITRPATTPPTKAENEKPSSGAKLQQKGSAVKLCRRMDRQGTISNPFRPCRRYTRKSLSRVNTCAIRWASAKATSVASAKSIGRSR